VAAGLLFVGVLGGSFLCNCFTVRDTRDAGFYFYLLVRLDFVQDDVDLKFAHPGNNGFLGFGVKHISKSLVLFGCADKELAKLVVVLFGNRVDRDRVYRFGQS